MRLLIAYDGSLAANRAIDMLRRGGFPDTGVHARVIAAEQAQIMAGTVLNLDTNVSIGAYEAERERESLEFAAEAAGHIAHEGELALKQIFPNWDVTPCARVGSPAETILGMAKAWKPDLIVLGSRGRSAVERLFLGSVSLRVAREAPVSVRVSHTMPHENSQNPPTLVFAFDTSHGASKVVGELLRRSWPAHTRLHIVSVIDVGILSTRNYLWLVGSDLEAYEQMKETRIEASLHALAESLRSRFDVTSSICIGSPIQEILHEARRLHADAIFMGARGLNRLERIILGSVVQGVASRAETAVEIIR